MGVVTRRLQSANLPFADLSVRLGCYGRAGGGVALNHRRCRTSPSALTHVDTTRYAKSGIRTATRSSFTLKNRRSSANTSNTFSPTPQELTFASHSLSPSPASRVHRRCCSSLVLFLLECSLRTLSDHLAQWEEEVSAPPDLMGCLLVNEESI
ncbi:hypothetical protein AVEN_97078-1 [Araneus ventricosus]|uniref:Uncharacterized protein n=1 Tax=Araneus ventricosus TaxID=182803 RepID=A0A4Y2EEK7_ARAVE|nr:hypothetical protein AVEN_97078-1 [Araneus ventricosus]